MSPYEVLGVDPSATPAELRSAYLRRARAVHPDVLGDVDDETRRAAEERMRELNDAWRRVNEATAVSDRPRAFVVDDHDAEEIEDDIDLSDVDLGPPPGAAARLVTAAGPIVLLLAAATIFFGLLFTSAVMIAVGFAAGAVAAAAFLLAPLLVMSSARHER